MSTFDVIRVLRWYIPNSLRLAGNYAHIFVFGYCLNLFFKVQGFLSSTLRKLFTSFSLKEDQFVNNFLGHWELTIYEAELSSFTKKFYFQNA